MDDQEAYDAAIAIQLKLEAALEDFDAQSVVLSRDEAITTFGLVSALIDAMMVADARKPGRSN